MNNLVEHKQTTGKVFIFVFDLEDPAHHVPRTALNTRTEGRLTTDMVAGLVHLGAAPGQAVPGVVQRAAHVGDVLVSEGEDAGGVVSGDTGLVTDTD